MEARVCVMQWHIHTQTHTMDGWVWNDDSGLSQKNSHIYSQHFEAREARKQAFGESLNAIWSKPSDVFVWIRRHKVAIIRRGREKGVKKVNVCGILRRSHSQYIVNVGYIQFAKTFERIEHATIYPLDFAMPQITVCVVNKERKKNRDKDKIEKNQSIHMDGTQCSFLSKYINVIYIYTWNTQWNWMEGWWGAIQPLLPFPLEGGGGAPPQITHDDDGEWLRIVFIIMMMAIKIDREKGLSRVWVDVRLERSLLVIVKIMYVWVGFLHERRGAW